MTQPSAAENSNPALRIVAAIDAVRAVAGKNAPSSHMVDLWALAFEIDHAQGTPGRMIEVVRMLGDLLGELDRVREGARGTGLPPAAYSKQLQLIERFMSPQSIGSNWAEMSKRLDEKESLHYLRETLASLLPPDERTLPQKVVDEILQELAAIESLLVGEPDLSPELVRFVSETIDATRRAVRDYPFLGAEALQRAHDVLVTGLARYAGKPKEQKRPAVMRMLALGAIIGSAVTNAGKAADGAKSVASVATAVYRQLPAAMEKVRRLTSGELKLLMAGEPPSEIERLGDSAPMP